MKLLKISCLILIGLAVFFFTTNKYSPIKIKSLAAFNPETFYKVTSSEIRRKIFEKWKPTNRLEELQRQAMLYEADRDYYGALAQYKQIMEQDEVSSDLKAITHIALQRCYAQIGDGDNEFRELLWIRDHIMTPSADYSHLGKHLTTNKTVPGPAGKG